MTRSTNGANVKTAIPHRSVAQSLTWIGIGLLLTGFAVFLVAQHRLVFLYHDDWGFAVLDHMAKQHGFKQQDFSVWQLLSFLKDMYMEWSGRIMSFGAHVLAQRVGLSFVQILQATLLFAFVATAVRLTQVSAGSRVSAFVVAWGILLYLALPESILAGGLYWYSASSSNAWSLPIFLLAAYRIMQDGRVSWMSAGMLTLSLTFHEQIAVSILAFLFVIKLWGWRLEKIPLRRDITKVSLVLAAAIAVILAPGNFIRKEYSAPFYGDRSDIQIFLENINAISYHLLWPGDENVYVLLLITSVIFLVLWLWLEKRIRKTGIIAFGFFSFFLTVLYITGSTTAFAILIMIGFSWYLFRACLATRGVELIFAIHVAALASLLPLLIAPYFMGRTGIIFLLLEMVPILFSTWLIQKHVPQLGKLILIAALAALALPATAKVYQGYAANMPIHHYNDRVLRALGNQQENSPAPGSKPQSVHLFKLEMPKYAETPADQGRQIQAWMRKYYGINPDTRFEWIDPHSVDLSLADIPDREADFIESGFDVYIESGHLLYVKPQCSTEDRKASFNLRFLPVDPRERDPFYFNKHFSFDGVILGGVCLTTKKMPDEPFAGARTRYHEVSFENSRPVRIEMLIASPIPDLPSPVASVLQHAALDILEDRDDTIHVQGWAFHDFDPGVTGYVQLSSPQQRLTYSTRSVRRPDVKSAFPTLTSDEVGFSAAIPREDIPRGEYKIRFILQDRDGVLHAATFADVAFRKEGDGDC